MFVPFKGGKTCTIAKCPWVLMELKGSLYPSKNENKLHKDLYCTLHKFVLIRFIQRNQGHRDPVMHEFSSSVNKVNKAVAKVRTIDDRLPSSLLLHDFSGSNIS